MDRTKCNLIVRGIEKSLVNKAKKIVKNKGLLFEPIKKEIISNGLRDWVEKNN